MFDELKKDTLVDLQEKETVMTNKKNELVEKIDKLRKSSEEYNNYSYVPQNNPEYISFKKKYSNSGFVYRFLHKKDYLNKEKELLISIKENSKDKYNELLKEVSDLEKQIKDIEDELASISSAIKYVENVDNLQDLKVSYEYAQDILHKNGVDINNYSPSDILKLGKSIETTDNTKFMENALATNPFNIIYDQTNNYELYYNFVKELNYNPKSNDVVEMQNKEMFDKAKKSILELLEKSKNGQIIIKQEHILEVIRFYFKDAIMYENGLLYDGNSENMLNAIVHINQVILKALELSNEDYLRLASMYNPNDNNYYCHRTGEKGLENLIFQDGLRISDQGIGERLIVRNARKVDCLLAIAGYENFYGGNGSGDARIILEIPKNIERPIGSNSNDGRNTYILPEYVMASLYDDENEPNKSFLHVNNHQNTTEYQYLYEDGYKVGDSSAAIVNPSLNEQISSNRIR